MSPVRVVRADHIFRGAPFFVSLLNHGARSPCLRARSVALLDFAHPLTCCSQRPRAYLGSCVSGGKGLDQPVRDARRSAGRLIFLRGDHDHGQLMLVVVILPADRAARLHAVDTRRVVLKYRQRRAIFRNELSCLIQVREKFNVNALGSNDLGKGRRHLCVDRQRRP